MFRDGQTPVKPQRPTFLFVFFNPRISVTSPGAYYRTPPAETTQHGTQQTPNHGVTGSVTARQEMTFGQVDLTISENTERKVRIRMPARSATIIDALRLNPTPSSGVFHHGTHHGIMHLPGGCGKGELTSYRNSLQVCVLWIVVYCLSASSFSRSSIGSVNTLSTALSREPAFRMFGQARLFQRDASRDVVTL